MEKYAISIWIFMENPTTQDDSEMAYLVIEAESEGDAIYKVNCMNNDKETFEKTPHFFESPFPNWKGWKTNYTWEIMEDDNFLVSEYPHGEIPTDLFQIPK